MSSPFLMSKVLASYSRFPYVCVNIPSISYWCSDWSLYYPGVSTPLFPSSIYFLKLQQSKYIVLWDYIAHIIWLCHRYIILTSDVGHVMFIHRPSTFSSWVVFMQPATGWLTSPGTSWMVQYPSSSLSSCLLYSKWKPIVGRGSQQYCYSLWVTCIELKAKVNEPHLS